MEIKKLVLGPLENNCYIIKKDKNCLVVDPACEFKLIKENLDGLNVEGILVTHYHYDHIGALGDLVNYSSAKVYDFEMKGKVKTPTFTFEILDTKGHKDDCVSFKFDDFIMTGDFLFKGSIGRTDLEGASVEDMRKSLNLFKSYNKDYKIYPGHGDETTLKFEKENNYFMKNL